MKTLNQLSTQIDKLIAKDKAKAADLQAGIDSATKKVEEADTALIAADKAEDTKATLAARQVKREAEDLQEIYIKRQAKHEAAALIDKAEYTELQSEITAAADAEIEEQNNRAAQLIAQLKAIADESSQTCGQANDLMHRAQYDLYKDQDALVNAVGKRITQAKEYKAAHTVGQLYSGKIKYGYFANLAGDNDTPNRPTWIQGGTF